MISDLRLGMFTRGPLTEQEAWQWLNDPVPKPRIERTMNFAGLLYDLSNYYRKRKDQANSFRGRVYGARLHEEYLNVNSIAVGLNYEFAGRYNTQYALANPQTPLSLRDFVLINEFPEGTTMFTNEKVEQLIDRFDTSFGIRKGFIGPEELKARSTKSR